MRILHILAGLDLSPLPQPVGNQDGSTAQTVFSIFLALAGAAALVVITLSGFRLTISRGDPQSIAKAKNSIIYAVIGLVVIAFAAVITRYVFNNLK